MNGSLRFRRLLTAFFASLLWSLNVLLAGYTLLLYALLHWIPTEHWSAGLLLITMPVAWLFNVMYVLIWLPTNPYRCLLSVLALALGYPFWPRTFSLNGPQEPDLGKTTLQVLSYNVMRFDAGDYWQRTRPSLRARHLTNYVVRHEAPVKCFQEFYSADLPVFQTLHRLDTAGYRYRALLHANLIQQPEAYIGVAIFSKLPILQKGREIFDDFNGLVWADIDLGTDTVRVINVHLQSMGIRFNDVLRQEEMAGVRQETRGILGALRYGFVERRRQVRTIERHLAISPHPVLLTGDFNDTPYSTVYERLRRRLRNAFEDRGRGFGFTLNRPPRYIRIDNQFYGAGLTALDFQTLDHVIYSDHYPVVGTYQVK